MRVTAALILVVLLAAVAAGCGGGDDETAPPVAPGAETEPLAPGTETVDTATDDDAGAGAPAGITSCEPVEDAGDGRYEIEGVGTVVVRQEGGRLHFDSVEPAEGWNHELDDRDADEVEVEFFRDGERLDFEVELDDGRVEAEICPDDD